MKEILIVLSAGLITLCTARPAPAVMTEYSTTNRTIAVTNVLPTSEVRPLAAYVIFSAPATGTVSISRVTRGVAVPLARHGFTNAAALTWFPPADFPIRRGEAFAVSSTVARFTLQLETSNGSEDIQRTDAPEWYDDGRPYSVQIAGGGNTQVTVTNTAQLFVTNSVALSVTNAPQFILTNHVVVTNSLVVSNTTHLVVTNSTLVIVTNAPQIVITNIVNVSTGGGGGSFIPNDATFVTTNGAANLWDDGSSLHYGNINGVWFGYMGAAQIGMRGESGNTYYMGFQDDFGTPQLIFHDPTTGTKTLAELAGGAGDNLGNGFATTDVDLQSHTLTASTDTGGYRIAHLFAIHGFPGGDSDGGTIEIIGGAGNGYTPGAITIRAGGGGSNPGDGPGATLTLAGGNGEGGSGSVGANVIVSGGAGGAFDGTVVLAGNNSHGNGSGGILLDLQNADLKVQSDSVTVTPGTTEDVTVSGVTFHFIRGIYTGHTGP